MDLIVCLTMTFVLLTRTPELYHLRVLEYFNTHSRVGVLISVRVGDQLQENVKFVKDVCKSGVTSVICHDLDKDMRDRVYMLQKKKGFGWN